MSTLPDHKSCKMGIKYQEVFDGLIYFFMSTIKHFEDIEAWQTARKLTDLVYSLTNQKMFSRDYGLVDQMRRAAVSIMSNIAEGFESQTDKTFMRYLGIAKSSSGELRSQLYAAFDQRYISEKDFYTVSDLCIRVSRQTSRFISYLNESKVSPQKSKVG
jgi:four helix bundle protein